jgi:hypothetical protein
MRRALCLWMAVGCGSDGTAENISDPCKGDAALSSCLSPVHSEAYYIEQSNGYFNTMDYNQDMDVIPPYSERVVRWEWPPWLRLTGYTRTEILASDALLRLLPSTIPERDCRAFDEQPFGRCYVTFYYDDHEGLGCPIYEEFTFNDAGEITWIEAWSDLPGMLPSPPDDPWAEGEDVSRLSTRIPGLGNEAGRIDPEGQAMIDAGLSDADVEDFRQRALDWKGAWLEEIGAAGDDMWERGCGW